MHQFPISFSVFMWLLFLPSSPQNSWIGGYSIAAFRKNTYNVVLWDNELFCIVQNREITWYNISEQIVRYYSSMSVLIPYIQGATKRYVCFKITKLVTLWWRLLTYNTHYTIIKLGYNVWINILINQRNNKILSAIQCPARPKAPQIYLAILSHRQFNISTLPKS